MNLRNDNKLRREWHARRRPSSTDRVYKAWHWRIHDEPGNQEHDSRKTSLQSSASTSLSRITIQYHHINTIERYRSTIVTTLVYNKIVIKIPYILIQTFKKYKKGKCHLHYKRKILQNFHKITSNPMAITSSRDAGFYTQKNLFSSCADRKWTLFFSLIYILENILACISPHPHKRCPSPKIS